ncbi:MAG TPA: bifunctional phosphoribosylaminoimidazolecarboxamide formyltransferase/IMP cyclohydrolase [Pyrinomonadaceae bacterium]|jgi:phosphoribosylaminoimidazolecarboxamide formyltransferase/IMP cyclohydrolase
MSELRRITRALISVSDKTGVVEFAHTLSDLKVEIISTGGTAKTLREAGIDVRDVSDVTGFAEMMDGRVKTLHPLIHGAFLALRDNDEHVASMREHGIEPIDLVVVNLYPFEQTICKESVTVDEAVENIDIGGPAMIRSASKNWRDIAVVTDTAFYPEIVDELKANDGSLSLETREKLAAAAFMRTARYDATIAGFLEYHLSPEQPDAGPERGQAPFQAVNASLEDRVSIELAKVTDLRYGENPHQHAALYTAGEHGGIANAEQLHGKEMSYNNYVDADAAWDLVQDFDELVVAIIKHTNPSGVGIGRTNDEAYRRALSTDPVSAFGGIVAFNRKVDAKVAASVVEIFSEVIVAPDYDAEAIEIFRSKKNLRILKAINGDATGAPAAASASGVEAGRKRAPQLKQISGGYLVQDDDAHHLKVSDLNIVTERQPADAELLSMLIAWRVCKHVKSNAIVFANQTQTTGVGAGQMNRVDSVRIAAMRAERFDLPLKGCALASDAFFPFRDNVDEAAKYGVTAIIQPGGSVRDEESIAAANEHGIAMAFTGIRHFRH